jgi:MoaA/NifB/PqqE/SkfB family radical SAM enzyme
LADDEIRDDSGNKFELDTASFDQIQNCNDMQTLRQQFLNGERPATCRKCWNEEDAGRTSKRMHTLDRLKHILPNQIWETKAKPLMFLDLKLGNICNLKCRICGSWSSSTFATEEMMAQPAATRKKTFAYQMLRAGAWPRTNTNFWSEIEQCLDQIRYIEFTGGEPFMINEHFDMLQGIVDRGIAGQVEIHYNTNGTIFPERGPEIWKHFKTVEVAFSIDDVGKRFEYQRANAKWDEVKQNIEQFRELQQHMPNLQLQCCSTINVFNVFYLDDLALWIGLQDFDFVYWNMMHEAYYFSISTLPESAKRVLTQRLQLADVNDNDKAEFNRIIDFMNNGASLDGVILRTKIAELDRVRQQDMRIVAPEFAELINYQGPDFNE